MNNVIEFNHGMASGLMLAIAMLQDDLHDFSRLIEMDGGLPLRPMHAAAYNEILDAKKKLERARRLLVERTGDLPIRFHVDEAWINELEIWRGNRSCAG